MELIRKGRKKDDATKNRGTAQRCGQKYQERKNDDATWNRGITQQGTEGRLNGGGEISGKEGKRMMTQQRKIGTQPCPSGPPRVRSKQPGRA
eukprot:357386-Chlamydomonas_euryale.AAC.8